MFKFGFGSEENQTLEDAFDNKVVINEKEIIKWKLAEKIDCDDLSQFNLPEKWNILSVKNYILYHIVPSEVNNFNVNKSNLSCDIIPAEYEGGFKIWDCTYCLLQLMVENELIFENKTVLDLGCGNGLLGIMSFVLGAKSAHFQDYNEEVIRSATIPTVIKNVVNLIPYKVPCRFFCGDWMSFSELINFKYDIILTSATIYNRDNYEKLISVFKKGLKEDGFILIAAKTYYFGNGGGTRQFEECLEEDNTFNHEVLWSSEEGVQQEILKLTFKNI